MGAGKTTFIKAICEKLGVKDVINSPTFAIINEYQDGKALPSTISTFIASTRKKRPMTSDMRITFIAGNVCFIEWPEMISDLIPGDAVEVHIDGLTILPGK